MWLAVFFFFKQKTAYERRISDWSSDVCSSDLTTRSLAGIGSRLQPVDLQQRMLFPGGGRGGRGARGGGPPAPNRNAITVTVTPSSGTPVAGEPIGSASCRERACPYV